MHVLSTDSLLGADIATVGARLGPPLQCRAVGDEVHLWRRDGTPIPTRNVHGPVPLPAPRSPSRDAPP
mgnify:CR=1 FL=1